MLGPLNYLHKLLDKMRVTNWLGIVLFLTILLRVPSFFEPYYYGDEMIYLNLGEGVRQGLTLYKDIFDNKPPLIYLTAAVAGNLFLFKTILAFWNLATIVVFWNLVKILFKTNEKLQKIATVFFALLTTLPTLEGNTVNAELFMIGLSLLAFYIVLKNQSPTLKQIFLAGSLIGVASLFKIPAAFDAPVIVFFWLITTEFKNWKKVLIDTFYLSLGFVVPILATFLWYLLNGSFSEYFSAAFFQNINYIGSWGVNVPFTVRAGIVALGVLLVFIFRKKLSSQFVLLLLWALFSLFAVVLSQRPYPHYLVQSLAPLSILIGILLAQKTIEQSLSVLPLTLMVFVPFYYHFYDYKIIPYYSRFFSFVSGKITKEAYFNNFSPNTNRNYKLAEFLANSSTRKERVFVWDSDAPTIYALSRRLPPIKYVVPYHVDDYSNKIEVVKEISSALPKFIITTSKLPFPEIKPLLLNEYILIAQIDDAEIWSKINK